MGRSVEVTITFLRQTSRPAYAPQPRPPRKISIMRAENPPTHFYRYLYDLVGAPWNWVSRRNMSDDALRDIITDPAVSVYVLSVDGAPAGIAEIDGKEHPVVYIRFFGLAPDFIGAGLGRFFLANAIDLAWSANPSEVRLETCTLDHPAALSLYQKFGFTVFDQRKGRVELIEDKTGAHR